MVLLLRKSIRLSGVYVGSREMFRDMNAAIGASRMRPVIDRVFGFEDARSAYHAMGSDRHFGKIVISLGECERVRLPRTTRAQLGSRVRARQNHLASPFARFCRDVKMAWRSRAGADSSASQAAESVSTHP